MRVDKALAKGYGENLRRVLSQIGGQSDITVFLEDWERKFAKYIGTRFSLALNSGSDALQLALTGLGIKAGEQVIIPNITYPVVGLVVNYIGATPVLVEVEKKDLNIDVAKIEESITDKTKAIMAVHMFSQACDIEKILRLARKYNLLVIEDVCQAESSSYKGKKLGSFADCGCFSFSYYKPLSSCGGGGGMITFNNSEYKKFSTFTQVWRDDQNLLDLNKRFPRMYLMDLAAVETKFKFLPKIIESRRRIEQLYREKLSEVEEIEVLTARAHAESVLQNLVIFAKERDALNAFLRKQQIVCMQPYTPLHLTRIFGKYGRGKKFGISEHYQRRALHLPLFSFMKEKECLSIVNSIKTFYNNLKTSLHP